MDDQGPIPVLLMTGYSPRCEVIKDNLEALNNTRVELEVVENTTQCESLQDYLPHIAVLDLANLHQPPGNCVRKVKNCFPGARILAIHIYQSSSLIEPLFEYGADGYLTYEPSKNELEAALLEVLNGNKFIPDSIQ